MKLTDENELELAKHFQSESQVRDFYKKIPNLPMNPLTAVENVKKTVDNQLVDVGAVGISIFKDITSAKDEPAFMDILAHIFDSIGMDDAAEQVRAWRGK